MKKLYSRYRKLTFAQGAAAAVTFTSVFALAAPVTGLFQFNPGTTISSAQMNQNFSILKTAIENNNSQTYKGTYDASTNLPDINGIGGNVGDYYVVTVAGYQFGHNYAVGDWAIWNGTVWNRIPSNSSVTTVFGRTGAIAPLKNDYSLNLLSDVNISGPTPGSVLQFNGSQWINSPLPTCSAGQVLKSDGMIFMCVTDNAGAAAFSGVFNKAVMTDASGNLTTSSVTAAELNYLSGVTSPLQTQLNMKESSITASTTAKYWRGDKTFQVLDTSAVPENTNLYFTNARTLNATLSGFSPVDSAINPSDTILQAFNKAQGQLSTRVGVGGGSVTTGSLQVNGTAVITVPTPLSPSEAANKGYVDGAINSNGVWTKSGPDISFLGGMVNFSTGAASAPVIRTASQPTGIFFPAGDQMAFSLAGNEVMRLANGKVAIGPGGIIPNNDLEVSANAMKAVTSITSASSNAGDVGMLVLQRSRGGIGAPAVVQNADAVGILNFSAYNSSMFAPVATIEAVATGSYSPSSNPGNLLFKTTASGFTTPQERMRIDYTGNIGVGTVSPAYKLDVTGDINASGVVRAAGSALSSDKRLKKNIVTISNALEKLLGLRGVEFDWRNNDLHDTGVIAQEVEAQFPNLVLTDKNGYKSVKYSNMAGVFIESTKELNTKITKLETENKMLKTYLCERDPNAPFCE